MTKLQKSGTNWTLCLPKALIEGLGWEKHDNIRVRIKGENRLELVKED